MNFVVNMLIEWIPDEDNDKQKRIERILYISNNTEKIIVINVIDKTGLPFMRLREELAQAYELADIRILQSDTFSLDSLSDEKINRKYKVRRDRAFSFIEFLEKELGSRIFNSSDRHSKIAEICKQESVPKKLIYSYLRRYWQGGCNKNALLPRFKNCGNRGKKRIGITASSVKPGRPTSLSIATQIKRGIVITAHIEKLFEKGIKKFYLTREKNSFMAAYNMMIDAFFNVGTREVNEVEIPVLPESDKLPSYDQFYYWYRKYYKNSKSEKELRLGKNKFDLLHRDLFNDSTALSFGPGSVYMIDATIADVYLVSSFNRNRIIGRPIVYLIVDVFSRMIVGFSVTLEGPSWVGAMLAIDNMVADKVEFCAEYGIKIERWQWDCHFLPDAFFADRGELESNNSTVLVDKLGCRIHNTPPYRGDLKGIVERQFGIANTKLVTFLPGKVKKREPGEKDHRLDATLTLHEFRASMITHILTYNLSHKLTWYRPDEFLVADDVPLKPISLWKWGIQNRSGILRSMPRNAVRFNLLPRKEATVSRYGIHFKKDIYYLPPPTLKERGRSAKVTIAYDPRSLDYIYIAPNGSSDIIPCPLTPASQLYLGRDWHEAEQLFAIQNQQNEIDETEEMQSGSFFRAHNKHIVKEAKKAKHNQILDDDESNASKLKGIKQNRIDERENERLQNPWFFNGVPQPKQLPSSQKMLSSNNEQEDLSNENYVPSPDYLDEIDRILDENQEESENE